MYKGNIEKSAVYVIDNRRPTSREDLVLVRAFKDGITFKPAEPAFYGFANDGVSQFGVDEFRSRDILSGVAYAYAFGPEVDQIDSRRYGRPVTLIGYDRIWRSVEPMYRWRKQ